MFLSGYIYKGKIRRHIIIFINYPILSNFSPSNLQPSISTTEIKTPASTPASAPTPAA